MGQLLCIQGRLDRHRFAFAVSSECSYEAALSIPFFVVLGISFSVAHHDYERNNVPSYPFSCGRHAGTDFNSDYCFYCTTLSVFSRKR